MSSDIILDQTCNMMHALIYKDEAGWILQDNISVKGTWVAVNSFLNMKKGAPSYPLKL